MAEKLGEPEPDETSKGCAHSAQRSRTMEINCMVDAVAKENLSFGGLDNILGVKCEDSDGYVLFLCSLLWVVGFIA